MKRQLPTRAVPAEISARLRWTPSVSVILGSCLTALPWIPAVPLVPPFGLLMLLSWRLLRPDAFRIWAPVPLGLFDDLVSGQPLGSAMLLWTLSFFAFDVIDRRLLWRDFRQNWLLGAVAATSILAAGALVAGTRPSQLLLIALTVQAAISALVLPLFMRTVIALDGWRFR